MNQAGNIPFKRAIRTLLRYGQTALRGSIDTVHNGCCQGWVFDTEFAAPVDVELFVDEQLAGRALAGLHREDLEREGLGDGRHGFSIEIPAALRDGRHHRVEVRSRDGRKIAVREAMQIVPKLTPAEFDRHAPWVDRDDAGFERELARLRKGGAWMQKPKRTCVSSASMAG